MDTLFNPIGVFSLSELIRFKHTNLEPLNLKTPTGMSWLPIVQSFLDHQNQQKKQKSIPVEPMHFLLKMGKCPMSYYDIHVGFPMS